MKTRALLHTSSTSESRPSLDTVATEQGPTAPLLKRRGTVTSLAEESHSANPSGGAASNSAVLNDPHTHVCICQPDPRIPRPRNAFILYRQHHQAAVIAENQGLSNPDISKRIGEQWNSLSSEVKDKWKALAEEEKSRHQQQYPTYRYQPKRNSRNSSAGDRTLSSAARVKCAKCGGRSVLTSGPPSATPQANEPDSSVPPTPTSALTPTTRVLPVLGELSLRTPVQPSASTFPPANADMTLARLRTETLEPTRPTDPVYKRRRLNSDQQPVLIRSPRYALAHGTAAGPSTPFPMYQSPIHPHPSALHASRRESLPSLREGQAELVMGSPSWTTGFGTRHLPLSHPHRVPDRSLILPPLQTGVPDDPEAAHESSVPSKAQTVKELIMELSYRNKIQILSQVSPPASFPSIGTRGPLIAVESDDTETAREIGEWLCKELGRSDELTTKLLNGSDDKLLTVRSARPIIRYHRLVSTWIAESDAIVAAMTRTNTSMSEEKTLKAAGENIGQYTTGDCDDQDDDEIVLANPPHMGSLRRPLKASRTNGVDTDDAKTESHAIPDTRAKPIVIISNYSLHMSNFFACSIPIGETETYTPSDHWQWAATQWRGVVGPDLTVYLRSIEGPTDNTRPAVEIVDGNLFVVNRGRATGEDGNDAVERATLRRLGFEVGEWVHAFGRENNRPGNT